jgi:hypothetical protein
MLTEINARIAAEIAMENAGITPKLFAKLQRAAQGKRVRITAADRAAFQTAEVFASGYFTIAGAQVCMGETHLYRL